MPILVTSLLSLIQYAPQAVSEINALYQAIRHTFSPADQATIDSALAAAQKADWASTQAADDALEQAAKRL